MPWMNPGLPQKKAAGVSYKAPLFFGDQTSVDQFVVESKKAKPFSTVSINTIRIQCHLIFLHRHAVTSQREICLQSSSRYHALDETAVSGCSCRHDFPVYFINLKHGERLEVSNLVAT